MTSYTGKKVTMIIMDEIEAMTMALTTREIEALKAIFDRQTSPGAFVNYQRKLKTLDRLLEKKMVESRWSSFSGYSWRITLIGRAALENIK